jgi:hypothetical protein
MDIIVKVGVSRRVDSLENFIRMFSGVDVRWIKSPPKQGFFKNIFEIKSIEIFRF